jgi:hypothetical protein
LHRLHTGVYAVGHTCLTPLAIVGAALIASGPDALVSYRSATTVWDFLPACRGPVDITVVGRRPTQRRGIRAHETRVLPAADRSQREGLPVTSPHRTLLDLAEVVGLDELAEAVGASRVARWVTPASLVTYARAATGRRGARPLKAVADQAAAEGFTRSKAERSCSRLCAALAVPMGDTRG